MLGICVTEEECAARTGGSAQGNCASGFGVCCLTVIEDPANAITNVSTYIYIVHTVKSGTEMIKTL